MSLIRRVGMRRSGEEFTTPVRNNAELDLFLDKADHHTKPMFSAEQERAPLDSEPSKHE